MKRYLVFASWNHYPSGGAEDFRGDFDSLATAKRKAEDYVAAEGIRIAWAHVLDTATRQVLEYHAEARDWKEPHALEEKP